MGVPTKVINDLFFEKVGTSEGKDKIAEFGGTYIRDRLREVSFARKIVPAIPVQRSECQRSVNHDTLVRVVDIEPNSRAMSLSFRGQPTAYLIRAPRYEIPFWTISSQKFEKHEQELLDGDVRHVRVGLDGEPCAVGLAGDECCLRRAAQCFPGQVLGDGGSQPGRALVDPVLRWTADNSLPLRSGIEGGGHGVASRARITT